MNKSKVMLLATYAISILLLIGVILFFSMLNNKIENDLARSSKVIGSPEFTKKFIEKLNPNSSATQIMLSYLRQILKQRMPAMRHKRH
ncbi:MAG: hypothetical protein IPK77_16785 [Cellvibrio sp.]|nr:hypothetical protein [Cellvibrio sp.]